LGLKPESLLVVKVKPFTQNRNAHLFQIILIIHITAGFLVLFSGFFNIAVKKGDNKHKIMGRFFYYPMLTAGFSALSLSGLRPNNFLFMVGIFTLYLVVCGQGCIFHLRQQLHSNGKSDWGILTPLLFYGSKKFQFNKNARIFVLLAGFCFFFDTSNAQVFLEKKSRHRFAQMNIGLDVQSGFGGATHYVNTQGNIDDLELHTAPLPRFVIGGTHFWGHADFYTAIPLFVPTLKKDNQEVRSYRGVETVFKYYPLRIENHKIRSYLGISFAPFHFSQRNANSLHPDGPELNNISFPLLGGLTYNSKNKLIELGLAFNYQNKQNYYLSRTQVGQIRTPQVYASLSYRYMLETTLSAEKDWESGRTEEITRYLADRGRLNGFYLGAGISSAFWLKESNYNQSERPYINPYGISIMPDFALGYYLHKADINIAVAYRGYGASTGTYGVTQNVRRNSVLFEATKSLFDYHGFVPFVGPAFSYEQLSFEECFEGATTHSVQKNKPAYALTFGWDIRPNRIQSWILRTNLRWYPNLYLDVALGKRMSFDNLELNFIQLIIYPGRIL
jgi:uncharacterized membrane protein